MKRELRWRGANSISKFYHHNINGGAVSTIHDVTGRRLVSSIYSWDIYGFVCSQTDWSKSSWQLVTYRNIRQTVACAGLPNIRLLPVLSCTIDGTFIYIILVKVRKSIWPLRPQFLLNRRAAMMTNSNGAQSVIRGRGGVGEIGALFNSYKKPPCSAYVLGVFEF
jgi:hypothetical protein